MRHVAMQDSVARAATNHILPDVAAGLASKVIRVFKTITITITSTMAV